MNYKKILKFIDKCLILLKQKPKRREWHSVFLLSKDGMAIWLKLSAETRHPLKIDSETEFDWCLSTHHSERYCIDHCDFCTADSPHDLHQEYKTTPLNTDVRRKAWRAKKLGLLVEVPEPIYPKVTRGFSSLEEFRKETKDIFPVYFEKVGWTFPVLAEGLNWDNIGVYPKIIAYSTDGKVEYNKNFYLLICGFSWDEIFEIISNEGRPEDKLLIDKIEELLRVYESVENKYFNEKRERRESKEKQELEQERQELAREFGVSIP